MTDAMTTSVADNSSDDELDWEEIQVPEQPQLDTPLELELELEPESAPPRQNIEITLQARPTKDDAKKKAAAAVHAQRVLRTTSHKIHTVALLANARIRNKWANDLLLHARLLSITPLALQNGFAMIHKSRIPEQNKRGRLFEAAVERLVTWWCDSFSVTATGHIRNRTFEEVEDQILLFNKSDGSEPDNSGSECIRSVESLMKHLLMQRGCRDTSAQLFTALCRALDIPARLVVSLQSVPWKSKVGKPTLKRDNSKGKSKAPQGQADDHEDAQSDDPNGMEDVIRTPLKHKGKGKETANQTIKLRKRKSQSTSRSGSTSIGARSLKSLDPTTTPPVFWTEVFSRADARWFPVDPIRGIVNKRHVFDPSHSTSKNPMRQDNRMLYVIGLEEDGYGRDITARYAHEYTAKISKVQAVGTGPANGRKEWWNSVVQFITRPYRLQRDDLEDDELHTHQLTEGMPTTMAGFKNHPLYALSRHLRRDQVIDPPTELGKFRGEPVYPRSSVISLKTAENWMRQGRVIRQGCQPMKMIKQRAVTVSRQREMEVALELARTEGHAGGDEDVMQGMYAFSQTELYKPEPIKNGKIPKNDFGNIDLYVPSMLPQGAVHIPFKRAAKIAKQLGFDYAEAVTGFEFRKRRAMPVIEGIVAAADNENVIVEACLEAEQEAEERARAKQSDRVCKRWIRLVHGLRIRERLQKQYASGGMEEQPQTAVDKPSPQKPRQRREPWLDADENEQPGGYLTTADDVVQPFHLPRDTHPRDIASMASISAARLGGDDDRTQGTGLATLVSQDQLDVLTEDEDADGDVDAEGEMEVDAESRAEVDIRPPPPRVPKTMRELAEADAWPREAGEGEGTPLSHCEKEADQNHDLGFAKARRGGAVQEQETPRKEVKYMENAKGPVRRTGRGRSGTKTKAATTRMSKKRARRGSDDEHSDVNGGEDGDGDPCSTPAKRRRGKASTPGVVASGSGSSVVPPDPTSTPAPGRVLRPRRQKSETRLREERAMEEAYRMAVAD